MESHINAMTEEKPEEMAGTSVTPASTHLFNVNTTNPVYLNERDSEIFVHMGMRLLYLSQRGRPDVHTAVSFLCTRLQHPDDYRKLARVMKYLQGAVGLPRNL
jgi:hypothetical protein